MSGAKQVTAVLFATLTIGLVGEFSSRREPVYNGRTVTQWIESERHTERRYSFDTRFNSAFLPRSPEAQEAIKAIGTNAIPALLKLVKAKDSVPKSLLSWLLNRQRWLQLRFRTAFESHAMAFEGFDSLGEGAKAAAPSLAALIQDSDVHVRYTAFYILVRVHADREILLPVLLQACHDSDGAIQSMATMALHFVAPEEFERLGIADPILRVYRTAHATE